MRHKLVWPAHTRADCLFEISQLAQVTIDRFNSDGKACITHLNKAIRFAVGKPLSIRIPKLDMEIRLLDSQMPPSRRPTTYPRNSDTLYSSLDVSSVQPWLER